MSEQITAESGEINPASVLFYLSVCMGARPSPNASSETWEAYNKTLDCMEQNAEAGLLPRVSYD
jgi:hypothetical protein